MDTILLKGETEELYRFLMVAPRMPRASFMLHVSAIEEAMEGVFRFADIVQVMGTGKRWMPIKFKLVCGDWCIEKMTGQCGEVALNAPTVDTEIEVLRHFGIWALTDPVELHTVTQIMGGEVKHRDQFMRLPEDSRFRAA